ncbi:efflux RND transporter permease subunit [Bacillus suaedae]|uniref:Efflux RND transporter permease subunit n=1 Tax=Halalkalibacter suaedae TaxID=2822140 RepID=A0A941APB2_9BACI|nr:efflux RND transporter permease subunit [Bacillus suaedae]MBP3949948.1 efflux RND transporter permease subunit [Bacillus suaedae]
MLSWLLHRSKIFMVLFLLLVIVGVYTFTALPQRELPETALNIGSITTVYPGASVETVERTVTNPIEAQLQSIDGIEEFTSSSSAGFTSIIVTVAEEKDKAEVISNVRQAVAEVARRFPDGVQTPNVREIENNTPLVSYHLTADDSETLMPLYREMQRWKDEVEGLQGVANVVVKGVTDEQITLAIESELLAEKGLILPDILTAIEDELEPTPLGKQEVDGTIFQLRIEQERKVEALGEVLVGQDNDGNPVYLRDVGSIEMESKKQEDIVTYDGKPSISFTAFVMQGEDIPAVDQRVKDKIEELSSSLPVEVELVDYYSQANMVKDIFEGLFVSLAIAVVAVIVITSLGLTISGAIVVALAVPLSVLFGLIPLPFADVDLNQISIIGLIIALGILVDDSIVVNDNIQRRYQLGDQALNGTINGVKEIWTSIVTSTLAIVFTFLPLVFLSGGNGAFIRALPTVLITTILASTIVALLFVPMMRFLFYKKQKGTKKSQNGLLGKPFDRLADFYANKVLSVVGRRPGVISIIGLLCTTAIFGLIALTPFEFFPSADREEVTIDVTLPIGTTLEDTYDTLEDMANLIQEDPGVYETSIFAGTGLPQLFNSSLDQSGDYTGQIVARVDRENQTAQGLISEWTETLRDQFPQAIVFLETIEQGPPTGAPVTVTIKGPEMVELISLRDRIKQQIEGLGTELVVDNIGKPEPTILYVPNRERLADANVTLDQVSQRIRLATDGIPLGSFEDGLHQYDMKVYIDRMQQEDVDLGQLQLMKSGEQGPEPVSLTEFLTSEDSETLQRIAHIDGERAIVLRAFPGEIENLEEEVTEIVEEERQSLEDDRYTMTLGGENDNQNSFFAEITVLFTIVIFLVYLLIAFQFNSLTMPFLVLVAVYLAIAGAILGLFVTQTPISFLAVMGMVSLTGIVVRNSIVLIEFIEQRKQEGIDQLTAVMEAGQARIRPIILTAVTSIVALIPIAVSGDALFTPLAVTIISGILFSTLLTLIIVPALYLVVTKNK